MVLIYWVKMIEKAKTFKRPRNILGVNSLVNYKGNLYISVGATGEFWEYNGEKWELVHKLPEHQPWSGTTWGHSLWKEELWFGGMEADLEAKGIIIHFNGQRWSTLRPKLGPEIWDLTAEKILYAVDSTQLLKTENGADWNIVSSIPSGEGRCIEFFDDNLYVGTTHGLFKFSLANKAWTHVLPYPYTFNDLIIYTPFNKEWLIAATGEKRGGPYFIFNGESWQRMRIGGHMNEERLKMTTHGKGYAPFLCIPQTATRSGSYGGQTGLGRLFLTDWNDFKAIYEGACAITEAELYDGELYFGTAWNKSYQSLQGNNASVFKLSNFVENFTHPPLKYQLCKSITNEDVTTSSFFCPGYSRIWIGIEAEKTGEVAVEIDPTGAFQWKTYNQFELEPEFTTFTINTDFTNIRLRFMSPTGATTIYVSQNQE